MGGTLVASCYLYILFFFIFCVANAFDLDSNCNCRTCCRLRSKHFVRDLWEPALEALKKTDHQKAAAYRAADPEAGMIQVVSPGSYNDLLIREVQKNMRNLLERQMRPSSPPPERPLTQAKPKQPSYDTLSYPHPEMLTAERLLLLGAKPKQPSIPPPAPQPEVASSASSASSIPPPAPPAPQPEVVCWEL